MDWNDSAFCLTSKSISNNLNHGKGMAELGLLEELEACGCPLCGCYRNTYMLGAGCPIGREQGWAGSSPQTTQLSCKYECNQIRVDQPPKSRRGGNAKQNKTKMLTLGVLPLAARAAWEPAAGGQTLLKPQNFPRFSIHISSFHSPREKSGLETKNIFYLNLLEKLSSSLGFTPSTFDAMTWSRSEFMRDKGLWKFRMGYCWFKCWLLPPHHHVSLPIRDFLDRRAGFLMRTQDKGFPQDLKRRRLLLLFWEGLEGSKTSVTRGIGNPTVFHIEEQSKLGGSLHLWEHRVQVEFI